MQFVDRCQPVEEVTNQTTQRHIPEGYIHTVMLPSDNKVFTHRVFQNKMKKWLLERSNAKQLRSPSSPQNKPAFTVQHAF